MADLFYKDTPTEAPKPKGYFCPNGRRPNLVVLCRLPHTENGCSSTDYTVDGTETITTEGTCLERCPWLKAHPQHKPKK